LKKIFKNTVWLLLDRGVLLSVSLITTVIVARYLGPDQYGALSYCLALIGILSGVSSLGWDRIIIKDISSDQAKAKEILETQFFFRIIGALCVACVAILIINLTKADDTPSLVIVSILSLCGVIGALNVAELYFVAQLQSRVATQIKIGATLAGAVIRVGVVIYGGNIIHLIIVSLLETLFIAIGLTWHYARKTNNFLKPVLHEIYALKLIKEGWPLFIGLQLDIVSQKIYGVALEAYMSKSDYGQFMLALRIVEIPLMLIYISSTSFLPKLTTLKESNNDEYEKFILLFTEIATAVGVASWIAIILFGEIIIEWLFGSQYQNSALILVGMWGAVLIQANAVFRAHYLIIDNAAQTLMWGNLIGLVVSVPIALILMNQWGWIGAGVAFSMTSFFTYYLSGITTEKGRRIMMIQAKAIKFENLNLNLFK
jgi:O-antigen/teichoic acid export membrane protein